MVGGTRECQRQKGLEARGRGRQDMGLTGGLLGFAMNEKGWKFPRCTSPSLIPLSKFPRCTSPRQCVVSLRSHSVLTPTPTDVLSGGLRHASSPHHGEGNLKVTLRLFPVLGEITEGSDV